MIFALMLNSLDLVYGDMAIRIVWATISVMLWTVAISEFCKLYKDFRKH